MLDTLWARMTNHGWLFLTAVLVTAACSAGLCAGEREWTSANGKSKAHGELLRVIEDVATLRLSSGKERQVPLNKLSARDRAYVTRRAPVLMAAATLQSTPFESKKHGFSIHFPPGFERRTWPDPTTLALFQHADTTNFNLRALPFPSEADSMKAIAAIVRRQLREQQLLDYKDLGMSDLADATCETIAIELQQTVEQKKLHQVAYLVRLGDTLLMLFATTDVERFTAYRPTFDAVAESIRQQ